MNTLNNDKTCPPDIRTNITELTEHEIESVSGGAGDDAGHGFGCGCRRCRTRNGIGDEGNTDPDPEAST